MRLDWHREKSAGDMNVAWTGWRCHLRDLGDAEGDGEYGSVLGQRNHVPADTRRPHPHSFSALLGLLYANRQLPGGSAHRTWLRMRPCPEVRCARTYRSCDCAYGWGIRRATLRPTISLLV